MPGGQKYLKLHKSIELGWLAGRRLTVNFFLEVLTASRSNICQAFIIEAQKKEEEGGMKKRTVKDVLSDTRPPAVVELIYTMQSDDGRTVSLEVPFESSTNCVVAVPMDAETLNIVVQEIHESCGDGTRYRKRPREQWFKSKYKEVRKNYQRDSMFIAYRNSDGEIKTMHAKPHASDVPEIEEQRVREVEEYLHAQYVELHYGSELTKAELARAEVQDGAGDEDDGEEEANEEVAGEHP